MPKQNQQPLLEFNPNLSKLSENEKQVLRILIDACRLIVPLYNEQLKQPIFEKEEIDEASKDDPQILSPYTVIERLNGRLVAIAYHIKYAHLIKPIADKLEEASLLTENKEFGKALIIQANALKNGNYEQAVIAWLKLEPYIFDITIGPVNHFDDQLFSGKAAYQSWVGILDEERTKKFEKYKKIVLNTVRKALAPEERIDNFESIKIKTIDVVVFSGLIARTKVVGINLPMDNLNIVEKYGSNITLFNQLNSLRVQEQVLPIFNKIFTVPFKQGFTEEDLRRGYFRVVILHEIAHSYLYYRNSLKNLQELFPVIYELAATVLGLRMTGSLLLLDVVKDKQLESMFVSFISRSFYLMEKRKIESFMGNYGLGGTIFIKYMLENGALKQRNGLFYPNFMKMFISLHELSDILEKLLAKGTKEEAEKFMKKYSY